MVIGRKTAIEINDIEIEKQRKLDIIQQELLEKYQMYICPSIGLSNALVKMTFNKPLPSLQDLHYEDNKYYS